MMADKILVLGSSSPFRKSLLDRLHLAYTIAHPQIDETAEPGENAPNLVRRLALQKAEAVATQFNDALVIGCDQVAELNGRVLGKPADHDDAVAQLQAACGQTMVFHSALCLFDTDTRQYQLAVVPVNVTFKSLTRAQIENYLVKDGPYNCAGSIRTERLGIALIEKMQSADPTAIMGLPLITLIGMLQDKGIDVLG